jgi:hypothetical protein
LNNRIDQIIMICAIFILESSILGSLKSVLGAIKHLIANSMIIALALWIYYPNLCSSQYFWIRETAGYLATYCRDHVPLPVALYVLEIQNVIAGIIRFNDHHK